MMRLPLQKYDFSYRYDGKMIPFSIWSTSDTSQIRTVVFLGTVQVGKIPEWVARKCPAHTVVVQGAPHWLAKEDGADIPEFMYRFSEEAFKAILTLYSVQKAYIIADSQAAPGVLRLVASDAYSASVDKVAFLQPLGLNASAFGNTAQERATIFKKRITQNLKYQISSLLFDRRLFHNHRQLLRIVGYDNAKSNAQYSAGLAHDATQDLAKVYAAHKKIVIICGSKDMLFPLVEIKDTLKSSQLAIPVVVVPGVPHSPIATKFGMRLLDEALGYF